MFLFQFWNTQIYQRQYNWQPQFASGSSALLYLLNPEGSGQEAVTTDYLNGFQYESKQINSNPAAATLKFVPTAEGYYNFENNKYIYSYTD
ncbi:MAG: hypothetical protein JNN23_18860, partial [Chryseobacterium gambrini]|nr:hypothetical protein [Chryseobacterium gambrini]